MEQVEIKKRLSMVNKNSKEVSIKRQSELLKVHRSMVYRISSREEDMELLNLIYEIYML